MDAKTVATGLIKIHEGLRLTMYLDEVDNPTIGYGRNLHTRGISASEANTLLADDVDYFLGKLSVYGWFQRLDSTRQAAIVDMAFNVGLQGLLLFVDMINALSDGNWELASIACLHSKWANEVGFRANNIAHILATGQLP